MNRAAVRRRWIGVLALATLVATTFTSVGPAAAAPESAASDRQEQELSARNGIVVSYVSLALPLPAEAPAHPAACDRVGFVRYRSADGPQNSADADHVVIQQQGLGGGTANSDSVAFNTVQSARAMGQHIEFWALARRSACLDEMTGFDYALRTGNYLDAADYYFNGKSIDGQTFPGFRSSADLPVLDFMGLERVVRDQYAIMLHEIPDQARRQQKFVCTGISLGGLVTGFFSDWDFDGASGADQCAAFAAQDSMISSDPVAIQNTPVLHALTDAIVGPTDGMVQAGFRAGVMPRIFGPVPVLGTKAFLLLRLAGLAAHLDPDGESQLLAHLPHDFEIDSTLNYLFAPTYAAFMTNGGDGSGSIRDYRFTNTALLGVLIDNNSSNFSLFQQGWVRWPVGRCRTRVSRIRASSPSCRCWVAICGSAPEIRLASRRPIARCCTPGGTMTMCAVCPSRAPVAKSPIYVTSQGNWRPAHRMHTGRPTFRCGWSSISARATGVPAVVRWPV